MKLQVRLLFFLITWPYLAVEGQKAKPVEIPLAKLSVSFDEITKDFKYVRIVFTNDNSEEIIISAEDDYFIKHTKLGKEKIVHREFPDRSFFLSDFEAESINRVCKTFTQTLEQFERYLHSKEWDKCIYLDAFFPRFLKGFWYLYNSARCSKEAISQHALVNDTLYDVSLNSKKSIARVLSWQQQLDYITKLRIVTKELVYQTTLWQKKELTNKKRNKEISHGEKFEEAFELFVRVYFDMKPPPRKLPSKGHNL